MLYIWWDQQNVVYYELLEPGHCCSLQKANDQFEPYIEEKMSTTCQKA